MNQRPHAKVFPTTEKLEIETFWSPVKLAKELELNSRPNIHAGALHFRKYMVTVELVEESYEILTERMQYLWDRCTCMKDAEILRTAAKALDYELKHNWGSDFKRY